MMWLYMVVVMIEADLTRLKLVRQPFSIEFAVGTISQKILKKMKQITYKNPLKR